MNFNKPNLHFCFLIFLLIKANFADSAPQLPETNLSNNKTSVTNSVTYIFSSNLPIVIINTFGQEIPDEPKIVAFMGIIYNGVGKRNYFTDPLNNYCGRIKIEKRGWSSRQFPKKQYGFETQDECGENLNVSLVDLPPENDWVLHAPYSDKTLMRNMFTYQLARDMGWYASRTRFCELILNGEYLGVYVLMEQIKRDKNRVDIAKLDPDETSGDDLTGGYIFKIDKFTEADCVWASAYPPYYQTDKRIQFQYVYPKVSDIVYQQKQYIQNFIYEFETVMYNEGYDDPVNGYLKYVHLNSFIDLFIINELSRNVDGYRLSTYMYKDKNSNGGSLHMGPVWDYNIAFGNANYYNCQNTNGWMVDQLSIYGNAKYNIPFWWQKFKADPQFMINVCNRWQQLRQELIDVYRFSAFIDSVAFFLDESQIRNFEKWPILGKQIWPNYFVGATYQEELDYFKQWLTNRITWMDQQLFIEYSTVIWCHPDSVNVTGNVGLGTCVPICEIVIASVNIDSIIFCSKHPELVINQDQDTLQLRADTKGAFEFFCIAFGFPDTASVSPNYTFTSYLSPVLENHDVTAHKFSLAQNYPNPFNLKTTIRYEIPKLGHTTLDIYNLAGQKIKTVVQKNQLAGSHIALWDGTNENGQIISTGVYIYKLRIGSYIMKRKLLFLK